MKYRPAFVTACGMLAASSAFAQVGPDLVNSSLWDVARHGMSANGQITGYSSGNVTCNRGDQNLLTGPDVNTRPIVAMNMFRFKPVAGTAYSRIEQLGQGWCKWVAVPVNGTQASCGASCPGGNIGSMPPGCADVYGSGFNGSGMGARSRVNVTTGVFTGARGGATGETAIAARVQVPTADVMSQPASAQFIFETVDALPHDATWIRPGQRVAINAMNNATSHVININGGTAAPSFIREASFVPAITRWADFESGVTVVTADHDDTPNPNPQFPGTFIRSRFYVAGKATPLGGGQYRYEYAVYNLNSDRSCDSVTMPLPAGVAYSDFFFRHPLSHSGEPYSNTPWTAAKQGRDLVFSTQSYAQNVNANAIRWGTMYNFGFTTNVAPRTGNVTLHLFKPGTAGSMQNVVATGLPTVGVPQCPADMNGDGGVETSDLISYIGFFAEGQLGADMDDGSGNNTPDGGVTTEDLLFYLTRYEGGC